ncbi:hypothetical protein GCM10025787_09790 [Saccharopolyspora rosea]|uniref:Aminotransferase class V-fold PLP-dependent enzyme n=1 Tax=Saccharopolyspora rosea TaxID=524884 RepID=A0ABW3FUY8_9PSEU
MHAAVRPRKAIVVGAGPIGCLVAVELRKRRFDVEVYERGEFPRLGVRRGHSFNLTLTSRGLGTLDDELVELCYGTGIPLPQRVIHHADGEISFQPYGTDGDHHLLSIPRHALHQVLLDRAVEAGARFFFGRECLTVDPFRGSVAVAGGDGDVRTSTADIVIGCDGANSTVRHQLAARSRARMEVEQRYIPHGYVELALPPAPDGEHALRRALRTADSPPSDQHGLHVWPRGDFVLIAQPNQDRSYTATLFMPLDRPDGDRSPSFAALSTADAMSDLLTEHFPDVVNLLPRITDDQLARPSALKTVHCFPYHCGRAVLVGDAAHTMPPFYGQGINCSFEDVHALLGIIDAHAPDFSDDAEVARMLAAFSEARRGPGKTILDLSVRNLHELAAHTDDPSFHARKDLERRLHLSHPDKFVPLYQMVAFTDIPYDEAARRDEAQQRLLDELCAAHDVEAEADVIAAAYADRWEAERGATPVRATERAAAPASRGLALNPRARKDMVHAVVDRVLRYQDDLASGKYPASYPAEPGRAGPAPDGEAPPGRGELPENGTELEFLLSEIFDAASTSGMVHSHPGFLSHIPSGGLLQSSLGDFIGRVLNRFVAVWAATPGFAHIESTVIRWFCTMLGYGEGSFGYLTTGGSLANLMALHCALDHSAGERRSEATVYVSAAGHFSVEKAARIVGVPRRRVRAVRTRPDDTIDVDDLRRRIEDDRRAGLVPGCAVATAGTTNSGAIDDLPSIVRLCREQGVWAHVDGCFGGFFRITRRGREMLAGIEEADSVSVDAHKSLFLPHGTSALLVRDQATLRRAFEVPGAEYIPELGQDDARVDLCDYGPELTREIRGLGAWLPIKLHGIRAFEAELDAVLDLADELAERLRAIGDVQVMPRDTPHLPVVNFRLDGADVWTERLCELVCSRGHVHVSTSRLPDAGTVVRACVLQPQTDRAVIDRFLADVTWSIDRINEERGRT